MAQHFALTGAEVPAQTQWMKGCDWMPRDDAMLLLGVYRHGINNWEA